MDRDVGLQGVLLAFLVLQITLLTALVSLPLLPAMSLPAPGWPQSPADGWPLGDGGPADLEWLAPAGLAAEGQRDQRLRPEAGETAFIYGPWDGGGWADLHAGPGAETVRLGQALLGDPVRVVRHEGAWSEVEARAVAPAVWVRTAHLTRGSRPVREAYRRGELAVIARAPGVELADGPLLPFGARLPLATFEDGTPHLLLPDGRRVTVPETARRYLSESQELTTALEGAKGFRRVPYQLGANSRTAMDSAGLVHLIFRVAGAEVPRRIEQLPAAGREIEWAQARAGDVLFFSTFDPARPLPVVLLADRESYLAASPADGVAIGLLSRMKNRKLLTIRRYL